MQITVELKWTVLLRWLLGLLLVWAALGKLANPHEFFVALLAYRLPLPDGFVSLAAMVLPWLELLCGFLLVANYRTTAALSWALVLFVIFVVCTGQAWLRGLSISCGCLDLRMFGIQPGSGPAKLFESVGLAFFRALLLAAAAYVLLRQPEAAEKV